jgi:hypothetical protein
MNYHTSREGEWVVVNGAGTESQSITVFTTGRESKVKDPRTKKPVNIYAIDDLGRKIDIKRGFNNSEPHPNALI